VALAAGAAGADGAWVTVAAVDPALAATAGALAGEAAGAGEAAAGEAAPGADWLAEAGGTAGWGAAGWAWPWTAWVAPCPACVALAAAGLTGGALPLTVAVAGPGAGALLAAVPGRTGACVADAGRAKIRTRMTAAATPPQAHTHTRRASSLTLERMVPSPSMVKKRRQVPRYPAITQSLH
jgi:hypothetical protein